MKNSVLQVLVDEATVRDFEGKNSQEVKDLIAKLVDKVCELEDRNDFLDSQVDSMSQQMEDSDRFDDDEQLMTELIHRKLNGLANANHLVKLERFMDELAVI